MIPWTSRRHALTVLSFTHHFSCQGNNLHDLHDIATYKYFYVSILYVKLLIFNKITEFYCTPPTIFFYIIGGVHNERKK